VGFGVILFEADSLAEFADGPVQLALLGQGGPEVVVGFGALLKVYRN
jgi:hypothetical protein